MDRDSLERMLAQGLSLEQMGRRVDRHPSTVGYWLRKRGLRAANYGTYAPRGAPSQTQLEALAADGATLAEMANEVDRSIATVRYWLRRWEITRQPRSKRRPADPSSAPATVKMDCAHHGQTRFRLEGRGSYRCMRCRQERVSEWRRRVKRLLIEEAGGRCRICGYDRCPAAMQFHHVDPRQKSFMVSRKGITRALAEAREEAAKCVLLCANCHAEVEVGYRSLGAEDSPGWIRTSMT